MICEEALSHALMEIEAACTRTMDKMLFDCSAVHVQLRERLVREPAFIVARSDAALLEFNTTLYHGDTVVATIVVRGAKGFAALYSVAAINIANAIREAPTMCPTVLVEVSTLSIFPCPLY